MTSFRTGLIYNKNKNSIYRLAFPHCIEEKNINYFEILPVLSYSYILFKSSLLYYDEEKKILNLKAKRIDIKNYNEIPHNIIIKNINYINIYKDPYQNEIEFYLKFILKSINEGFIIIESMDGYINFSIELKSYPLHIIHEDVNEEGLTMLTPQGEIKSYYFRFKWDWYKGYQPYKIYWLFKKISFKKDIM